VRTTKERKEYLGEFLATESDLTAANSAFESYMNSLIPGSTGRIMYSLDCEPAADLEVVFPDKGVRRGLMLSGGERAIACLAMKLALFDRAQSPLYLFDEIEPSLDWGRNHNMQGLLKAVSQHRQLIMVTHLQSSIQMANTVHGVRIRPDGSSWLKFHFLMDERLFKIYKCC
ncbi:MAG: hypothetical protein FJY85_00455, partial [Deltaproteobacteria bacterium]|nr:hypothetical protein [Deltaproteobacteria bacterium]